MDWYNNESVHVSNTVNGLKGAMLGLNKRSIPGVMAAVMLAFVSGCSSYGSARIQSNPSGADVINVSDDTPLGQTPLLITRKADREESRRITVKLSKPGYGDEVQTFWLNIRQSSRINAEYAPQEITVELVPEQ